MFPVILEVSGTELSSGLKASQDPRTRHGVDALKWAKEINLAGSIQEVDDAKNSASLEKFLDVSRNAGLILMCRGEIFNDLSIREQFQAKEVAGFICDRL